MIVKHHKKTVVKLLQDNNLRAVMQNAAHSGKMQYQRKAENYHKVIESKPKPLYSNNLRLCGNVKNAGTKFAQGVGSYRTT